ncbi:MAG: hypothetical protein KAT15_28825 [Bacteroidales bacterium]|nr:hypothetical protein [Bacteroidales bacterium]
MRVFVLCTGRSGSLTFIRACGHITNYTSGHETRSRRLGEDRFRYPDQHIEADNRLVWFPGAMDSAFGSAPVFVHLIRNKEDTVHSYNRRWIKNGSLIRAYCEGIHQIALHKLDNDRRLEVVGDFYDQVNDNIRHFLRDKEKKITIHIENATEGFSEFWNMIGAEGNLEEALHSFEQRYNRSKTRRFKVFRHELRFGLMKLRRRIL